MLDCISGGRLVAGLPLGSPMDVNLAYGITPMEHRERYREAVELVTKAWQAKEIFAWNGKYFQLGDGEPLAPAHPAAASAHLGPGIGQHQHLRLRRRPERLLLLPELFGRPVREGHDGRVLATWWRARGSSTIRTARGSCSSSPSSETDAQAEADYARHVEYFYHKCLHVPPQWGAPPGNQDYRSLLAANRNPVRRVEDPKTLRYKDFVDKGYVIAGSPATVRERLVEEVIKGLHVGNLMVLVQIGSMPHELTLKNIDLFAQEVLPHLRDIWDEEGWENHWWPERLRGAASPSPWAWRSRRRAWPRQCVQQQAATVWQGRVPLRVHVKGAGPAVVFFHGPWGLTWGPFLDALAERFTVYAPEHPGTAPGEPDAIREVDSLWDLILCYDELLEHLRPVGGDARRPFLRRDDGVRGGGAAPVAHPAPGAHRSDRALAGRCAGDQLDAPVAPGAARARVQGSRRRGGEGAVHDPRRSRGGGARQDAPDVGDGIDGQVHLADPRQGAEEAHPPDHRARRC